LRGEGILPVSARSAAPARGPEMRITAMAAGPRPELRAKMVGRSGIEAQVSAEGRLGQGPKVSAQKLTSGSCDDLFDIKYKADTHKHRVTSANDPQREYSSNGKLRNSIIRIVPIGRQLQTRYLAMLGRI
jgi:hypothetical protein